MKKNTFRKYGETINSSKDSNSANNEQTKKLNKTPTVNRRNYGLNQRRKNIKALKIILALVLIDQIIKSLIPGIKNYGSAFGILQGYKPLFIIASLTVLVFLFLYKERLKGIGYVGGILFFSGTIGNLIDRVFLGYVRDFVIGVGYLNFNLADVYIDIGLILLVVYGVFSEF